MRHVNIPIFIPHLGCPNNCVFCNQRSISGHGDFDIGSVRREIETVLSTVGEGDVCEIAFFGGSFTGIDRALMISLLDIAQEYTVNYGVNNGGRVESIRLSTRPDYINDEILTILSRYSVRTIELGLQSMDDGVLAASKRGHDAETAKKACRLVKKYGFDLIGQMMIGLPSSTKEKEEATARLICELGADGARVYPTVVFYETELCDMAREGKYVPLEIDEAVERSAAVLDIFDRAGIPCIRVGLCASENLTDPEKVYGGAHHVAIGEMAMGELYYKRICEALDAIGDREFAKKELTVYVAKGNVSKAVGQNRKNKKKLCEKYNLYRIKVLEKNDISGYNISINIK